MKPLALDRSVDDILWWCAQWVEQRLWNGSIETLRHVEGVDWITRMSDGAWRHVENRLGWFWHGLIYQPTIYEWWGRWLHWWLRHGDSKVSIVLVTMESSDSNRSTRMAVVEHWRGLVCGVELAREFEGSENSPMKTKTA